MLMRYELKKMLKAKGILLLVFCGVIVLCGILLWYKPDLTAYTFNTEIYKKYALQFSGPYSEETFQKIKAEYEKQLQIREAPEAENASEDELIHQSDLKILAGEKMNALEEIIRRYENLNGKKELVYDLELEAYLKSGVNTILAILLMVCLSVLTVRVLLYEKECSMDIILYTCKVGKRKIVWTKIAATAMCAAFFSLLYGLAELWLIQKKLCIDDGGSVLYSYTSFENCALEISLKKALIVGVVIRVTGCLVYVLLLDLLVLIIKNDIASIAVGIGVMFCESLLAGNKFYKSWSFLQTFGGVKALYSVRGIAELGGFVLAVMLLLGGLAIVTRE